MQIKSTIICDSVFNGNRITTFEIEYPRFIHCFDEETQILSQIQDEAPIFRDFKHVFQLGCKVAQYTPEGESIEFVYPENTIEKKGTHPLITFDSNKHSMVVTDQHRVFTKKRTTNNEYKDSVILAERLANADYGSIRIPKAGFCTQKQVLSPEEIALIAWYVADGYKENKNTSSFHFRKHRKIDAVVDLLTTLGIEFKKYYYENDVVIRFSNPCWVDDCYDERGNKKFPKYGLNMTQTTYEEFWKPAVLLSDGNLENQEINTYSKTVAEQIQVVALLHGDAMNIRLYSGCYKQSFQKTNYVSFRQDKDKFESSVKDCTVYCVTVPSSFVVVRRKGFAYVSGNCEFMTHRVFSRNAMSSRAVPIEKMIDQVKTDPAMPVEWGLNKSGMQSEKSHTNPALCRSNWQKSAFAAAEQAERLQELGLHKQIVNRVLEPFQMMKTVVTATEWDNFFELRTHKDTQPEFQDLAKLMKEQYDTNTPQELYEGYWHLPYVETWVHPDAYQGVKGLYKVNGQCISEEDAIKISASCCAQVSYRINDNSLDKALKIYDKLITSTPKHCSPMEHQAKAATKYSQGLEVSVGEVMWDNCEDGVTAIDIEGNFWSGNFKNWIQYRQLL